MDAYEKVKAEALQRLQSFASSGGATPARPPRGDSGAASVPRAASFSRTGSVCLLKTQLETMQAISGSKPVQQIGCNFAATGALVDIITAGPAVHNAAR